MFVSLCDGNDFTMISMEKNFCDVEIFNCGNMFFLDTSLSTKVSLFSIDFRPRFSDES